MGREGGGTSAAGTGSYLVYCLVYCGGCNGEREEEGILTDRPSQGQYVHEWKYFIAAFPVQSNA